MGTRLFIGNLSYSVTEQELKEAFIGEAIDVRSVRLALDRETGRPRGFAFVETMTDDGAKASIEKLSGRILQGRPIIVEEAQAKPAGPRPGGGFGGPRPGGPPGAGGGFGSRPPGGPGPGPGGPRPGGFGSGPGGPPRPSGPPREFGPPRGPGGFRPGGFDTRGAGPPGGRPTEGPPRRERPEKKRSTRPKPEERERGNWRWDRSSDDE
jgi:cold-inducible RNA-binding protein